MSAGIVRPEAAMMDEERTPSLAVPSPPPPRTLEDTGLTEEFLADLLLKTIYSQGARTGRQLTDAIKLPFPFVDDRTLDLQQRRLIEVKGTSGPNRASYLFDLTGEGRARAREAMAAGLYVGPAPVPLAQYRRWVLAQSVQHVHVTRREVARGFEWLVLAPETLDQIGPAINSGRSLFLFGDSGNGKTAIAETIARLAHGEVLLPYAVEVDGQIMVTYDPVHHQPVASRASSDGEASGPPGVLASEADVDQRFVQVARPVVLTGGELTLDQLDLQYDPFTKLYQAPFQVKANGGVLVVDDFGRQRVPPRELLNRWIVPLEKRVDFLTLHTGNKFPVPFDCLLVFATNIDPRELVEEAFLRRIHYKVRVESPTPEQYERIFRRYAEAKGLRHDPAAVVRVYREFYQRYAIAPRACHPRDLIDHLLDIAKFLETEPVLSEDLMDRAGRSYFLDFPTER